MASMFRLWLIAIALAAVTLAAYWSVGGFDFANFDDQVYVTNNPQVRAGLTAAGVQWAFVATHGANWHPLTWLSHMTDVQLFGMSAGAHHVVNLAFHVVNTLLLWIVLTRLTESSMRSAAVAALFAVHPLHVESVAWIAERKDVLSAFFALLTIWSYAGYVRHSSRARYLAALMWFAFGLMSKPMLVTLPFVLLLLDVWPLRRFSIRAALLEKAPFLILSIASSVITVVAQRRGGALTSLDLIPLSARVWNALSAYLTYLWQTIWPDNLVAFYPYSATPAIAQALVGAVVLIAITALCVRLRRDRPYLLVGWLWFVVMLVPVIGVVQVSTQAHADRYTYLPHVGLFLAMVWGVADLARRWALSPRIVTAATAVIIVALAAATRTQASTWQNGIALWEHAVAVGPPNGRAHTNLGAGYASAGRHRDAITEYRAALALEPALPQAHYNLGLALAAQGETEEAVRHFREALRLLPEHVSARGSLANSLMDLQQFDEAIVEYTEALRRRPDDAQIHHNLGVAYAQRGRMTDAAREFVEAVRLQPDRAELHYSAGMAFIVLGDNPKAASYLREAVRLEPNHDRARRALAEIGR
jgi:Flp pilus assembly protein TadD